MKKYLITGLLIWVPLGITLWVLHLLVSTMDQTLLLLPEEFQTERWLGVHVPGMGVVLTFVVLFGTGLVAANIPISARASVMGQMGGLLSATEHGWYFD